MRRQTALCAFLALANALRISAQAPAPAIPDNTLNSTNTIGLPHAASIEGSAEIVNLNSGALTFFLPVLSLPQRTGAAPLVLGYTYDSNQQNLQQLTSDYASFDDQAGADAEIRDEFHYTVTVAPTTFSQGPLDLNIPQLSASLEYAGDAVDSRGPSWGVNTTYCVENVAFKDWNGSIHTFPNVNLGCNDLLGPAPAGLVGNSNDSTFYHFDGTNSADFIVYSPDGTAYHFANPRNAPCPQCTIGSSIEQYINMQMTSSVDRFGNTITLANGVLTDTLNRSIQLSGNNIAYKDANGVSQTVSIGSIAPAESTIPQVSGSDVGPYLKVTQDGTMGSCYISNPQVNPGATPQYYLYVQGMPDGWTPPVQNSSRQFSGISIHYSNTGQSYKLLFDSFGHLLKISYPEGGYHRYDYSLYNPLARTQGPITCSWPVAEVSHRYECANSSGSCAPNEEAVTTYTATIGNDSAGNESFTVQTPDNAAVIHTFTKGVANYGLLTGLEADTSQYSSSGFLLKLTHRDYATYIQPGGTPRPDLGFAYPFPTKITTTLEDVSPTLTSYTTIVYDTVPGSITDVDPHIDNPVETDVHDYSGNLINSKIQSWFYLGHLLKEPASTKQIDEAQGKQVTQTINHDSIGRITSFVVLGNDAGPFTSTYTPDTWGRPTAIQDPRNNTAHYGYSDSWADNICTPPSNSNAYLTSVTNAANQTTTYKYYSCTGQLASSLDPNGVTVAFSYDGASRIVHRQVMGNALADDVTVSYTDGPGSTITRTQLATPDPSIVTQYSLDGLGRAFDQVMQSDPQGPTHQVTYFNQMGGVQAVTNPYRTLSDPTYGVTSYLYDALGRKIFQCEPDNGGTDPTVCVPSHNFLEWDYAGNVVTNYDESRRKWKHTSDSLGRLTNVGELGSPTQALNLQTSYIYDGFGNLLYVNQTGTTGESARNRSFSYDSLSRLITSNNPETGTICYGQWQDDSPSSGICQDGYDGNGNLLAKTDANQITLAYSYDSMNRLVATSSSDGNTIDEFTYDDPIPGHNGIGRLTTAQSVTTGVGLLDGQSIDGQSQYTYDAMGHISTHASWSVDDNGPMAPASAQYNLAGNIRSLTYPDGRIVDQTWDGAGHVQTVIDRSSGERYLASASYTPSGAVSVMIFGNQGTQKFFYNNRLQECENQVISSFYNVDQILFDKQTFYGSESLCQPAVGNNGNIAASVDPLNVGLTRSFGYDGLNRLTTAARSDGGFNYSYQVDSFGNMIPHDNLIGSNPSYSIDPATNQLLRNAIGGVPPDSFGHPANAYTYDYAGNLLSTGTSDIGGHQFTYDPKGQLVVLDGELTYPKHPTYYAYNAEGQRSIKLTPGQPPWTAYAYFGSEVIAENVNNDHFNDLIYANGHQIARVDGQVNALMVSGGAGVSCVLKVGAPPGGFKEGDVLSWNEQHTGNVQSLGMAWAPNSFGAYPNWALGYASQDSNWHTVTMNLYPGFFTNPQVQVSWIEANSYQYPGFSSNPSGPFSVYLTGFVLSRSDGSVEVLYGGTSSTGPLLSSTCTGNGGVIVGPTWDESPKVATHYLMADNLGTTQLMLTESGAPEWRGEFLPFGGELDSNPTVNNYKFTGKERDAESGLDYFGARYYASSVGRWMNPDWSEKPEPIPYAKMDNPQSFNLYNYMLNDPLGGVDADGHTVYVVAYSTGNHAGDHDFFKAALTRAVEIMDQKDFDPTKDKVLIEGVNSFKSFANLVNEANGLEGKFGKVGEISLYSHGGFDGPIFQEAGPGGDRRRFSNEQNPQGFLGLKVNWADSGVGKFMSCQAAVPSSHYPSGSFAQEFANRQGHAAIGFNDRTSFSSTPVGKTRWYVFGAPSEYLVTWGKTPGSKVPAYSGPVTLNPQKK